MTEYCLSVLPKLDPMLTHARRILVACDFDGTLCSIASDPSRVHVSPAMLQVLRAIEASDRLDLAVISGRALDDVSAQLPMNIVFAGNHGLEIRGKSLFFEHECA